MDSGEPAGTGNTISGGTQYGPVLQAQTIHATFPAATAPTALAQLPPLTAGFTGRSEELAVLAGLLDPAGSAGPVLVSAVAGLAGVGKTTLAVQAARDAVDQGWFGGGVLFIDLHGYDEAPVEPAQALDALLRALGVPAEHIPPTVDERAGLYRSVLAQISKPVLVIADNASSEAQVKPLLPGIGLRKVVLVTSRHTLAGLGARLVDVTVLGQAASIALLDAALRAARPCDDRISADPQAAGRLAEICGGLPLALQITAALLTGDPALTAGELAGDMAAEPQRLDLLTYDDGSQSSALSIAAAFGLSYRKLDDTTARMFRLLAVCPGPDVCTSASAELGEMPTSQARKVLGALARAHLIEPAAARAGRWQMHDLVHLYAARLGEEHAEADGREAARDRLLGYYLNTTSAADAHLRALAGLAVPERFTGRDDAMAWLDTERANLVAAVTMAAGTGRNQAALHLALALSEYLDWRRRLDGWLSSADTGLNAARRLGDRQGESAALNNLGNALRNLRRFEEAITLHQEDLAICRATGDRHSEGMALNNLGAALHGARRFDEATTAYRGATAIYHEFGDRHSEGKALNNLGNVLAVVRQFDEAVTAHQGAAAIYHEFGDRHSEGNALTNLGLTLTEIRRFDEAITAHQDAAAKYQETSDRHGEGIALTNLGLTLTEMRRFEDAITPLQDAVVIFRDTGDRHGEGIALTNLGAALKRLDRLDEAIKACQEAVAIFGETGDQHNQRVALASLDAAKAAQQA